VQSTPFKEKGSSFMILEVASFGPFRTNSILIGCEATKKAVCIDPAFQSTSWFLQKAFELGLTIEKIFLTHSHWDHFADAQELKHKTHAELFVHSLDGKNIEEPGIDGIPIAVSILSVQADYFVFEGEKIPLGKLSFEVIHTPGHSPGGVCYYEKEENLLLSGDTLFQGTIGSLSLPTSDASLMKKSLEKLIALPENTRVIPGHGDETTIGKEKRMIQRMISDL
jgi:glyoxylase-like metal-dependent hydrolase (beta-lactamase superfamily II)